MTQGRQTWNAWDVPYFGRPEPPEAVPAPHEGPDPGVRVLPLAGGGTRTAERVVAVMIGIAGVVGGAALVGVLLLASFVLSFGSTAGGYELLIACLMGAAVAAVGVSLAVVTYRRAGRPVHLKLDHDRLEIAYKTFKAPFSIPRESVRVVAIDDQPPHLFTNNKRFPIEGAVPGGRFADALDNMPSSPWDDLDPDRRPRSSTGVVWEGARGGSGSAGGYAHDDQGVAGWASAGRPAPPVVPQEAYLWSAAGSSLPFLRIGPADVPNVAVIFHEPRSTPRGPWWMELAPVNVSRGSFRGGGAVHGVLVRVGDAAAAARAFAPWGVVRRVTAADVVDEGLLVAKPLAGTRAVVYGALTLGSILVEFAARHLGLFRHVR